MRSNVIGITGLADAGKDTVARYFIEHHGYVRYSLADPIKHALNVMFGWSMEQWEDRAWKEAVLPAIGKSPRQMAQTLGTEWGRNCVNQDLWLLLAEDFISKSKKPVVIPDVRFDNEAQLVRAMAGEIVHVIRPGTQAVAPHPSEGGLSAGLHDWRIYNDGTLAELERNLWQCFR